MCVLLWLGSNSDFKENVIQSPSTAMDHWHDGKELGLHKRSLGNSTNLKFLGVLTDSGNFIQVDMIKSEVDSELALTNQLQEEKLQCDLEE